MKNYMMMKKNVKKMIIVNQNVAKIINVLIMKYVK